MSEDNSRPLQRKESVLDKKKRFESMIQQTQQEKVSLEKSSYTLDYNDSEETFSSSLEETRN